MNNAERCAVNKNLCVRYAGNVFKVVISQGRQSWKGLGCPLGSKMLSCFQNSAEWVYLIEKIFMYGRVGGGEEEWETGGYFLCGFAFLI